MLLFYHRFPDSLLTPTVLYAQSMAHGRYQVPVDLETAERFALLNLQMIDEQFQDHPRHEYIKVFAENALAYIRARQGRFAEALELCTRGLDRMKDIYGDDRFALHQSILIYNTAQIYELIGDFANAYKTYEKALTLDPCYGEYANDIANLLQHHGRYDEALAYYQRAIDLCPPYYEAHLNRALLYAQIGDMTKAEHDYRRVLELKPTESRAYAALGALYLEQDRPADALVLLDSAIYHDPKDAQAWNNRGLALEALDRCAEAEADLRQAVTVNPRLSEAWSNLGRLYYGQRRFKESLRCLDRAVALSDDSDYRFNRAVVYQDLDRSAEALADLTAARDRLGDTPEVMELLGQIAPQHDARARSRRSPRQLGSR